MAGRRSSSACPPCSKSGDWGECSVPHSHLVKLQTQGFLPSAFMVPVRDGIATYDRGEQAEGSPNPSLEERICFIPHLLRGIRFPIHPFLRGLLEFYGLQLHNFTPASILHIAGYVALCELFLGYETHFRLWKKLFCLVPLNQEESLCQVGGPKYGISPRPDTYPALPKRHQRTSLRSGSILMMPPSRIQYGQVSQGSVMPRQGHV